MEDCEICGKPTAVQYVIEIEGAEMRVCENCSRGKQVLAKYGDEKPIWEKPVVARKERIEEDEIIDNYGEKIRKARESLGLPIQVVAEKISEKESTLLRVEKEKMLPSPVLVKKLEKELGIRLVAPKAPKQKAQGYTSSEEFTLSDVAIKKDK